MKRSTYISAVILLLLFAAGGYWKLRQPPIGTVSGAGRGPGLEAHLPRPPRPSLPDDTTHVTFPGLKPLKFSTRQTSTMAAITSPYEVPAGTLDNTYDLSSFRQTPMELTTDDDRILKLVANKGLFPTVANRKEIIALFKQQDVEIVRLGNDAASLKSRQFMLGLLFTLYEFGCPNSIEFREAEGAVIVPITELEIIPVTFIDRRKPYDGNPSPEERPGLLWMAKHDRIPGESVAMWDHEMPPEDARWVEWRIIPIDPIPPEMQSERIRNQENWIKTPGWTFERKIRSPNDPPDPPLPGYPWGAPPRD